MPNENVFQAKLIEELEEMFPGCIILKNDANYKQGFPDLTILFEDKWAVLDPKKEKNSPHRPNQDYYIHILSRMSYASFIYPENKERVLHELQQTFRSRRTARISRR
jgi:hypothetical protein